MSVHQEDGTSSHLVSTPSPSSRTNEDGETISSARRLTRSRFDCWLGADLLTSENAYKPLRCPDRGVSSWAIGAVVHVRVTSLSCLAYIYSVTVDTIASLVPGYMICLLILNIPDHVRTVIHRDQQYTHQERNIRLGVEP
jgi:hypothetical protein